MKIKLLRGFGAAQRHLGAAAGPPTAHPLRVDRRALLLYISALPSVSVRYQNKKKMAGGEGGPGIGWVVPVLFAGASNACPQTVD